MLVDIGLDRRLIVECDWLNYRYLYLVLGNYDRKIVVFPYQLFRFEFTALLHDRLLVRVVFNKRIVK